MTIIRLMRISVLVVCPDKTAIAGLFWVLRNRGAGKIPAFFSIFLGLPAANRALPYGGSFLCIDTMRQDVIG